MNDQTLDPEPTDREYLNQCDEEYRQNLDLLLDLVEHKETWRSSNLLQRYYVPLLLPNRTKLEYARDSLMLTLNFYKILMELTDPDVVGERDNIAAALKTNIKETYCDIKELLFDYMEDRRPNQNKMALLIAAEIDEKVDRTYGVNIPLAPLRPLLETGSYSDDESEGPEARAVNAEDGQFTEDVGVLLWLTEEPELPLPTVTITTVPEDVERPRSRSTRRIRAEQAAYLDKVSQIRTRFTLCSAMYRMARIDLKARYDFKQLKLECTFWLMEAALSSLERLNGTQFTNPEALLERERHVKDLKSTFIHEFNTVLERLGWVVGSKNHKERALARMVAADVDECTKRARHYGLECDLLTPLVVAGEVDTE